MLQTISGQWRMQTLQILHVSHRLPSSVFPRHRSDLLMTENLMIVVSKFFSKLLNLDCHKRNNTTNAIWERKRSGKIMTEPFLSFSLLPIIITCKQLFHVAVRLSRSGITGCLSLRRSNSLWDLQITWLFSDFLTLTPRKDIQGQCLWYCLSNLANGQFLSGQLKRP